MENKHLFTVSNAAECPITKCWAYDDDVKDKDEPSKFVEVNNELNPASKFNDWQGLDRKIRWVCTNGAETKTNRFTTLQNSICYKSIRTLKDENGAKIEKVFHKFTQNTTVAADVAYTNGKYEESGYKAVDPYAFAGRENPNGDKCPIEKCNLYKPTSAGKCSSFVYSGTPVKYDATGKMI